MICIPIGYDFSHISIVATDLLANKPNQYKLLTQTIHDDLGEIEEVISKIAIQGAHCS
jgi:hypothetical protein